LKILFNFFNLVWQRLNNFTAISTKIFTGTYSHFP